MKTITKENSGKKDRTSDRGRRKVLFIDRDGTLIKETVDEQIDAFEKMIFYPKVFTYLGKIAREMGYELVMITNQDGLGTDAFPEDTFWPVHHFIMRSFENEGVYFDKVFLDRTFPHENADTRKPGTALLTEYFSDAYDLAGSYVIGDRLTDMELAKNLGSKGIFINDNTNLGTGEITVERSVLDSVIALENNDWEAIYEFLKLDNRMSTISRKTNETDIQIKLDLDGTGLGSIKTGLAFFRPHARPDRPPRPNGFGNQGRRGSRSRRAPHYRGHGDCPGRSLS